MIFPYAPALPLSSCVLAGLDGKLMGRLYVPKPPKKRSDGGAKSRIIARAVFGALSMSKTLAPVAARQIPKVRPPLLSYLDFFFMPFFIHPAF